MSVVAVVAALGFLWWRLIDHLRLEWSINPQYAYGWAVPFLCLYLAWRRVRRPQQQIENAYHNANQEAIATYHVLRFTFYVLRCTEHRSLGFASFLLFGSLFASSRKPTPNGAW